MKKICTTLILLALLSASCKKIDENDILRTDSSGQVISRGQSRDWITTTVSGNADANDIITGVQQYLDNMAADGRDSLTVRRDCTLLPDTLEIWPYANPVHNTQDLKIHIRSSVPISIVSYTYVGLKRYSGGGGATVNASPYWLVGKKALDLSLAGSLAYPDGDMKLTVVAITRDGCAYTASGYVLVR